MKTTSEQGGDKMEQKKKRTSKKEIVKETRNLNVMFASDGKGHYATRISLPSTWLEHMGISPDDREAEVTYSPRTKKITIRKKGSEEEVGE